MTNKENSQEEIPVIINLVNSDDIKGVEQVLLDGSAKIEDVDESGMTALQHACYRANLQTIKLLLKFGADVNSNNHSHNYSCLHFSALSGNIEAVNEVLSAGAKTYHTNSLKRTAAQMAAFVGNHEIVALINNYFPLSDLHYYTKSQGLETESKLPLPVAEPLHNIIMQSNLHPVYIAMQVEKSKILLTEENLSKSATVLSLMCEKEAKRTDSVNEVKCLKLHYLSYLLRTLDKEAKEQKKEAALIFETLIKKWLLGRNSDGFEQHLESYVRDAIKSFPHAEMPLFVQVCRNLSPKDDQIWALHILSSAINGQKGFADDISCATCGSHHKTAKQCSKCKIAKYCDQVCQRLQWHTHKNFCVEKQDDKDPIENQEEKLSEKLTEAKIDS